MAIKESVLIELQSKYSGDGYKSLNKDINETADKMKRLESEGKKNSAQFKTLEKDLKKLESLKTYNSNLDAASKSGSTFASSLKTVGIAAAAIGTAALIKFSKEAFNLGLELSVLSANFEGTAKDIELFQMATAGTVSKGDLIKLSNYASDLGVTLKDQALLFSLAEDAADKYGGGVESNFQRVINATDGSAKGLRAVGISITEWKKAVEDFEKTNGIKLEQLDEEEQLLTRLNLIYKLTGTTVETVTTKVQDQADVIDSLFVAVKDATAALGQGFVESLKLSDTNAATFNNTLKELVQLAGDFGRTTAREVQTVIDVFDLLIDKLVDVYQWFEDLGRSFWGLDAKVRGMNESVTSGLVEDALKKNEQKILDAMKPSKEEFEAEKRKKELEKLKQQTKSGTSRGRDREKEKDIKYITDRYSVGLWKLRKDLNATMSQVIADRLTLSGLEPVGVEDKLAWAGRFPIQQVETAGIDYKELLSQAGSLQSELSNVMNILGIGADTFLAKMLSGFNSILSLIQSFLSIRQAVSGIASIIQSIATGGAAAMPSAQVSGGTTAYFRIDLNSMNIVREGTAQLDRYKNSIRVSI